MPIYVAEDYDITAIADAIRDKTGTSEDLEYPAGLVSAMENLVIPPKEMCSYTSWTQSCTASSGSSASTKTATLDPKYIYCVAGYYSSLYKTSSTYSAQQSTGVTGAQFYIVWYNGTSWQKTSSIGTACGIGTPSFSGNTISVTLTASAGRYIRAALVKVAQILP